MSLPALLLQHLEELRNSLSWGNREIKSQIQKAEEYVQEDKPDFDFSIVILPFESACKTTSDAFSLCAYRCFTDIFADRSRKSFPSLDCVERILGVVFATDKSASEAVKIACCQVLMSCFQSRAGEFHVHALSLYRVVIFLVSLFDLAPAGLVRDEATRVLTSVAEKTVSLYREPFRVPPCNTIDQIAEYCAQTLTRNAVAIKDFAPNSFQSTIADVDMVVLIRALTKSLTVRKYSAETECMCCQVLGTVLEKDCMFFKTADFCSVIRTDIHVVLLSLTLETEPLLQKPTARLISLCWEKFAPLYLQGLNDVLSHGLIPALSSPVQEAVLQALSLFSTLTESSSQFLVDAFVNYDCDQSGFFQNIFEQTVNLVVKNAYPGQPSIEIQKSALSTLIRVLQYLWKYFNEFSAESEKEPEEAQVLLDAKKAKDALDHAVQLFKRSPKKGLTFFIEHRIVENTPESIAEYLFNTVSLDPAGVGEILGGASPQEVQILKCFVDMFDFKGMSFEQAFRTFLSKFQIPGEAQMIDRVMEQFGVKFYSDNPQLFSCADTVYVLAFSTLMLHTDAHHPNVTKRMTLEEFVANNKGIDQGKDLPSAFLATLYKGITSQKIFTAKNVMPNSSLLTRQQQKDLYHQQCQETLAQARTKLTTDLKRRTFHRTKSPNLIGPMFNLVWRGVLAALTMSFEETEDEEIIRHCIDGFELCTHIASHCFVEDALDTMVDSFAKFTRLRIQTDGLKPKNYRCTTALIKCAINDRNYLKGAWEIVLGEISALDRVRGTYAENENLVMAEQLFALTVSLDRESILDFVQSMSRVSESEIHEPQPRFFTLIKFSDVSYWNMDRPMFIWKDIWSVIGNYLIRQGRNPDDSVAAASVDIIRQLSRKFLSKEEIKEYHFQLHFLQPFIDIYDGQESVKIKNLVLFCINQIIDELAPVLHSGWDAIFQIMTFTSLDESSLRKKGFKMVDRIVTDFMRFALPFKVHIMSVLASFVSCVDDVSLSCAAAVRYSLIAGLIGPDEIGSWQCLLMTIGKCCQHPDDSVKRCSEEILLSVLTEHGCVKKDFPVGVWQFFFDTIIVKLFTPTRKNCSDDYYKDRIALFKLLHDHLFFQYEDVFEGYFAGIFNNMCSCLKSESKDLAYVALRYMQKYLTTNASAVVSHIDDIARNLDEYIDSCEPNVLLIEVIQLLIKGCSGKDCAPKALALLQKVMDKTDSSNSAVFCSMSLVYFKSLVDNKLFEKCAKYLRSPIETYVKLSTEQQQSDWNQLIVFLFKEIMKLDSASFDLCIASFADLVKLLIMCDSLEVREALAEVLSRKFC